ncbi:MAG TPA: tetratricopeptide repeat protein [Patescibacteria group bacterium]|nr:tetratricopeptide repeat protein [Patescibacteria group bacterium]
MKSSFWFWFIVGFLGLTLITIGVLSYIKTVAKNNEPTTILKPEVIAILEQSEKKRDQAQELLSKKESSTDDQKQAKELLQQSIDDAKKATETQPNNPQTWLFLAKIYEQLIGINPQNAVLAEEAVKKALELQPKNPKILQELATVYIHQERYREAEEILLQAIELDPTDPNYYFKLGNVYKEINRDDDARKNYLKAKELTPDSHATNSAMIELQLRNLGN